MLHMLGQRELSRSLFPVGGMPKAETRALAERFGLPVASKPDSQELCFAPSGEAGAYLGVGRAAPDARGRGRRHGRTRARAARRRSAAFTVGQRRGLGVSGPEPSYVLEVDPAANRVVVGPGELLARSGAIADRVSWVAGEPPSDGAVRGRGSDPVPGRRRPGRGRAARRSRSGSSSGRRSAASRPGRARSSTAATSCSAAVASSTRSAEPDRARPAPDEPGAVGGPGYHRPVEDRRP